jgi:hypothetical protein
MGHPRKKSTDGIEDVDSGYVGLREVTLKTGNDGATFSNSARGASLFTGT